MNDRESGSSIPVRICRCSSPSHQGCVAQYASDSNSDIDDDDENEQIVLSKVSVYQSLNTHSDLHLSIGIKSSTFKRTLSFDVKVLPRSHHLAWAAQIYCFCYFNVGDRRKKIAERGVDP